MTNPENHPPGIDLARLRAHLDRAAPRLVAGDLSAEVVAGGKSNLTYVLTDGWSRWVLRRPPLGHVLATAHDMVREHTVLSALAPTGVPVPRTVFLCRDRDVLGVPFYLMEYVAGTVYRTPRDTAGLGADRAGAVVHELIDVLADIHELDPASIGLARFGRPEGFLDRQLDRWKKQLDASRSRELPGADRLHASLSADVPVSGRGCLLHGDYRLDNVLIGSDGRIAAVLDWEMASLGDPLTDLGLFLVYYSALFGPRAVEGSAPTGFPTAEDLIARYARRRAVDLSRLDWYVALACFKLAVISEGIHLRYTAGQTVGGGFDQIGQTVVALFATGLAALSRDASRAGGPRAAGLILDEENP